MKNNTIIILIILLLIIGGAGFYTGYRSGSKPVSYVNDTIIFNKTDSFFITKWKPYKVTVDSLIYDTLYDTLKVPHFVQVPISKYNYKDTLVTGSDSAFISELVSGYKVNVENITMRLKTTSTVVLERPVIKQKRFVVGPYIGTSIYNNKIIPSCGLSITYKIFEL